MSATHGKTGSASQRPTVRERSAENGRLQEQVRRLERQLRATQQQLRASQRELQAAHRQIERLTQQVEKLRREGKRQAAPFRKQEQPSGEPKKPGRKKGKRHGRHAHRSVPPRIDETYDVPLPKRCPHCGGDHVGETHVDAQYQTEIPRSVIYRKFDVHVGTCDDCGRGVQGRHDLQTSTARGAAASQLGPNVHAMLALLNKQLGLSHGKCVKLLGTLFEDLHVSRAASARSMMRTASRCKAAYHQVGEDVKGAPEVAPDETHLARGGLSGLAARFGK